MRFNQLFQELKRRNVFRVATAYTVAAWLIIQVVTAIEEPLSIPGWFDTVVIVMVALGFPIALIIAWAFELTPEGLKKTSEVELTESVTQSTGKKINTLIISALSLALIFVLVERFFFAEYKILADDQSRTEQPSVAVLPFVNMSSDQENEYFSDGLSEELLNGLARINELKVAGRTSSFKFKGQNENLTEIGKELGVRYILEGSVRKSDNQIRITAQLINVEDGYHLWSGSYDRELNNIFAIQEEITRQVLDQMKIYLLPEYQNVLEEIPTTDIEAYQAYLKANHLIISREIVDINVAIELYKTAIKLDPLFAEAHGRLAFAYDLQAYYGNIPEEEAIENVYRHAQRAMDLNDRSAEAHLAMGLYELSMREFEKARDHYLKSLELNPNLTVTYNLLGLLYLDHLDEPDKWKEVTRKMYEVDPLNPLAIYNMGRIGLYDKDPQEAERYFTLNMTKNPEYIPSYLGLVLIYSDPPISRYDKAFIEAHKAYLLDKSFARFPRFMILQLSKLNLEGPASYYMDMMQRNFPESNDYLSLLKIYGERFGDYRYYEESHKDYSFLPSENIPPFYIADRIDYMIHKGEIRQAIQLHRENFPELFTDDIEVNQKEQHRRNLLSQLYMMAGKEDSARIQRDLFCDFAKTVPDLEEEGKESLRYLFMRAECLVLNDQFEEAGTYFEEILIDRRELFFVSWVLRSNRPLHLKMKGDPGIRSLLITAREELDEQAENVRQYLVEEGEWQEEWDRSMQE